MPVFQFQCQQCYAIFDHFSGIKLHEDINCMNCGAGNISRLNETVFYPNKNFCPHDKELNLENLTKQMSRIMIDKSQKCGGCGSDGAPGKCNSGGGCGRGCSCKKIITVPQKLVMEI